jgi:hypothetical protein
MEEKALKLQEKVKEKVQVLKKQGGFKILEGIVDGKKGIRNMNPKDEPRRIAFLTDTDKAEKRQQLRQELEILKELIEGKDLSASLEEANQKKEKVSSVLEENLREAFKNSRDLEASYRLMDLFFRNSGEDSIRNLFFLNIPLDEFTSAENSNLREGLVEHFNQNYDRFSLEDNYSMFVIPGYLGNNLDMWSKIASDYRMTLITDYTDEKDFEDIEDKIEEKKIAGADRYLANTIVTCNYAVARKKNEGVEDEDLFLPMSVPIAGKIYSGNGIQPPAGKKHGKIDGVLGTRLNFLRTHVDKVDKMGMVPIIYEKDWGTVAMSDTTLACESSDPDLKALGVVKAKDWIAKVLLDYFNSLTFQNYTGTLRTEIRGELNKFFDKITGFGGLIEEYTIDGPTKDPDNPQAVRLSINVKPYFATKHYVIDYSGTQGDFSEEEKS